MDNGTHPALEDAIPDPTGTGVSAGNEIVEIDAHIEDRPSHDPRPQPILRPDNLATIADELAELGADKESARVEIERRHMVDSGPDEHVLRFTAETLTEIAVILAVARVRATYEQRNQVRDTIYAFGHAIWESHDAPLSRRFEGLELEGLERQDGGYINPFKVMINKQTLFFVDDDGERVVPDNPTSRSNTAIDEQSRPL